ncbi:MAG: CoA ester lyase [Sphingosinicella sp.]|nr:CoA ester lyase [Sphingosinicella sp.]
MRSKLFVPGTRPDFFEKALAGEADAISFDLEDSVPEGAKAASRTRLAEFLGSDLVRSTAKTIIVRVNAIGTPHFQDDLRALAQAHMHLINLPKVEDDEAMRAAASKASEIAGDARLLVNIETPRALARARTIAAADPRIAGLQAGLNDLFEPLRMDRADPFNVQTALWQIRMAAAESGLFAYDGAWPNLEDADGFRREGELARSMGFLGKSCVHPSQVAIANDIFDRGAEIAQAHRILDAAGAAATEGNGAFLLDGKMIDGPAIAQARSVVAGVEEGR